jgi:putative ABC transport system permease protein
VPGFETDNMFMIAQTANIVALSPRELRLGRFFTPDEEMRAMRVAVLGASVAEALFPIGNPIGRPVVVDGAEYTVVGVLAKSKLPVGDNGFDIQINIPMKTARIRYPQLDNFQLLINSRRGMREAAFEEVRAAMRRIRRLPPAAEDDFAITTPDQIVQQFDRITGLISLVAIAMSAVGLLVGGIGVMNIMLVSVTERTREIGVRKALGARRRDIVAQFLVEAMTLTGVGGLLGILAAVSITFLVGVLVPNLAAGVQTWSLGTGLTVSVAIGLFFGVWPAVKASQLDPVEALRHE